MEFIIKYLNSENTEQKKWFIFTSLDRINWFFKCASPTNLKSPPEKDTVTCSWYLIGNGGRQK